MLELAIAFATPALMIAAALGAGGALLRVAKADAALSALEHRLVAFVLGMGVLGWVAFPLGLAGELGRTGLVILCAILATGLAFAAKPAGRSAPPAAPVTAWTPALLAAIAATLALELPKGLAPPADADSLAYHFALPRDFLAAGKIFFTPRAADGAIPLLQHMASMVALGIGGERAMTLWSLLSGWSAAGALYVLARRHLPRDWALALALLFLTAPAVVYASGSGQVEIRSAAFVVIATVAILEARDRNTAAFAALAGLAAGFYAASKYPGLLFVPLAGLAVVWQRRWFRHGLAFAAGALVAAAPFYLWHWWNTGDPFFPMLYGLVEYRPSVPWNADIHTDFKHWTTAIEKSRPPTLLWAAAYPFLATLAPDATFESGRTGFGPVALLLLPMALVGAILNRHRLRHSPLAVGAFLCVGFYLAWFLFGASQRVRHFLPIYPLLLLCLAAAAVKAATAWPMLNKPLVAAVIATVAFQFSVHAVFALGPMRHLLSNESREDYLRRTVPWYDVAAWANANLSADSRLLHIQRQLNYLLSRPYFFAHPMTDARIDQRAEARDPVRFRRELEANGITHLLAEPDSVADGGYDYLVARLLAADCVEEVARGKALLFPSRTIAPVLSHPATFNIFAVRAANRCALASP